MSDAPPRLLQRLARPAHPPSPGHRASLERSLLARFDALHPPPTKEHRMVPLPLWRAALAAAVVAAAAGASCAPAEFQAAIGQRIEIRTPAPLPPEAVRAAVKALEPAGRPLQVRVRVMARPGEPATTVIERFGDVGGLGDPARAVREALPAAAAPAITVGPIERTVKGDVADQLSVLAGKGLSPEALAQAIRAELEAAEPGAAVSVEVRGEGATREVEARVIREAPPAPPPVTPAPKQ